MEKRIDKIFEVFEKIENVTGRGKKEDLLKSLCSNCFICNDLKIILRIAIDPYMQLNITVSEKRKVQYDEDTTWDITFNDFLEMVDELIARKITGNKAKNKVDIHLKCLTDMQYKWFTRIINKNLKIGIGAKLINKIFPGLIRSFDIQLCSVYDPDDKKINVYDGNWIYEDKYDGERCICKVKNGIVTMHSRNGKTLGTGVEYLEDEVKRLKMVNGYYDGEIVGSDFNDTMSHKKVGKTDKRTLHYQIFDHLTLDEWNSKDTLTLKDRKDRLQRIFNDIFLKDNKYIHLVNFGDVGNYPDVYKYLDIAIEDGYEGLVLKNINSKYEFKRNKDWLKVIKRYTIDLPIVNVEEGEGKLQGTLGALVVDFEGELVNVGTGFTEGQRKTLWAIRDTLTEYMVEIEYREMTKNKKGTRSLRFPVFKKIRFDKEDN